MNEWRKEGRKEWMNEWMNEWKNEWTKEWMNEWMNERKNEWMNEWMKSLFKNTVKYQYDDRKQIRNSSSVKFSINWFTYLPCGSPIQTVEVAKRFYSANILRKIVPKRSSAVTEATLQVVSSWFRQVQFWTCVTKIKGQSSRSKHVTTIIWGELIYAFVH